MPQQPVTMTIRIGFDYRVRSRHWRAIARLMLLIGLFCFSGIQSASAGVTGSISGIVADKSDAVIAGAEVTARNLET